MVGKIQKIVDDYEKRLQEMPFIPRSSFRRRMLRQDGGPNRDILTSLFCDSDLAMQFLKDVGLLRSKVQCRSRFLKYVPVLLTSISSPTTIRFGNLHSIPHFLRKFVKDHMLEYYALCDMHNAELLSVCLMWRSYHSTVLSQLCRMRRC